MHLMSNICDSLVILSPLHVPHHPAWSLMMSVRADVPCVRSSIPFLRLTCRCIILSARLRYAYQFASGLYLLSTRCLTCIVRTANKFPLQMLWCGVIWPMSISVVFSSLDVFAPSLECYIETMREWQAHVFATYLAFLALT